MSSNARKVDATNHGDKKTGRLRRRARVADWKRIDPGLVVDAIEATTKDGGAIRFGYSRDGGAYAIGILGDGDPYTLWGASDDDVAETLRDIISSFA